MLGLTPRCPCHIIIPLYFRVSIFGIGVGWYMKLSLKEKLGLTSENYARERLTHVKKWGLILKD